MNRKRIGIFGGSFNPIHFGHIRLARHIRKEAALDEVWFMVSPQNPFKVNQTLLDDDKRLQLVKIALTREKGLKACDYEFRLPKPSYTWNTLQALTADYPDDEFLLVIGADNWANFAQWFHSADILAHHNIVVYPREGTDIDETTLPPNVSLVHTPLYPFSSTQVRRRIAEGETIDGMVPRAVARMITEEKLY